MIDPEVSKFAFPRKASDLSDNKSSKDVSKEVTPTSNIVTDFSNEIGDTTSNKGFRNSKSSMQSLAQVPTTKNNNLRAPSERKLSFMYNSEQSKPIVVQEK